MKPKSYFLLLGIGILWGTAPAPAGAQMIQFDVHSGADAVDGLPGDGICATASGDCTLRAAIMEANALPGVGQQINVSAPVITLTVAGAGEDEAATGDLDIKTTVHIVGAVSPPQVIFVDGAGLDRVFHIQPGGYLELVNIGVTGGRVSGGQDGGGILNDEGTLVMNRCLVQRNRAEDFGRGGGILNEGGLGITLSSIDANEGFLGGGIYNRGTLSVQDSSIAENIVSGEGGGIFNDLGMMDASRVAIQANRAVGNYGGGGIYNRAPLFLTDSWVLGNSAGWSGGGIANLDTMYLTRSEVGQNTSLVLPC